MWRLHHAHASAPLVVHLDARECTVGTLRQLLQAQHNISRVIIMRGDCALADADAVARTDHLTLTPELVAGRPTANPLNIVAINAALAEGQLAAHMPDNVRAALSSVPADDLHRLCIRQVDAENIQICLRDTAVTPDPQDEQVAEYIETARRQESKEAMAIYRRAAERATAQLPPTSAAMVRKVALGGSLTDEEREAIQTYMDAVLTDDDRRQLQEISHKRNDEVARQRDKLHRVKAKLAQSRKRRSHRRSATDQAFGGFKKGFLL